MAFAVAELALHPFSGKAESSAGIEQHWYTEGVATSHFSSEGLRLTGNPQIANAVAVLVMGDSHVEAFQVSDRQTMGSVLERRLRNAGKPWNVLQYGWAGADGPDYVYEAPLVGSRFHPAKILLIMNRGDFKSTSSFVARLVEHDSSVTAEPVFPGAIPGRPASRVGHLARLLKASRILYACVTRFTLILLPHLRSQPVRDLEPNAVQPDVSAGAVDLIVRGLKQAYGDKLMVLYTPRQPFFEGTPLEPQESALLSACHARRVACISLRERMIADLQLHHRLARGFVNTAAGFGHLNQHGHELAADAMFDWLDSTH